MREKITRLPTDEYIQFGEHEVKKKTFVRVERTVYAVGAGGALLAGGSFLKEGIHYLSHDNFKAALGFLAVGGSGTFLTGITIWHRKIRRALRAEEGNAKILQFRKKPSKEPEPGNNQQS